MKITLFSFGFKYGYPEADLVWDVRFLPNPYWVPELRVYTGLDMNISQYVLDNETGKRFLVLLKPMLLFLLDQHAASGRGVLTLAVGCTGGRHRSVAVVERLREESFLKEYLPAVYHRDIGKK